MADYFTHVAGFVDLVEELKAQVRGAGGRFVSGGGAAVATTPQERTPGDLLKHGIRNGDVISGNLWNEGMVHTFGSTHNDTFAIEYGGSKFFAKRVKDDEAFGMKAKDILLNEQLGPAIGNVFAPNLVVPTGTMTVKGSHYVVQNWQENAHQAIGMVGDHAISELDNRAATKMMALEYLGAGNSDRHGGNLMIKDGVLKEIDFGFSQHEDPAFNLGYSHLHERLSYQQLAVHTKTLDTILSFRKEIIAAADKFPSKGAPQATRQRLDYLQKLLAHAQQNPGTTWTGFERLMEEL